MSKKVVSFSRKGFTILEVMVVVTIIAILVLIVIASGDSAKKVARDNQRKTDISLLQVKLESYREQYGIYPTSLDGATNSLVSSGLVSSAVLPKDPSTKTDYQYVPLQFSGGTCGVAYHLGADMENDISIVSPVSINASLIECTGDHFVFTANKTYDVISPDAFKQPS